MKQAGETEFPCLLFFGSKREKLERKKLKMNGGMEAVLLLLRSWKRTAVLKRLYQHLLPPATLIESPVITFPY